jgi:hypothetical protein
MTKHRIYHLSNTWDDALYTPTKTTATRVAVDTRVNAALVDGAPTVDEYNWVDRDQNNRYDYNNAVIYNPESPKTAAGFNNPYNSEIPGLTATICLKNWGARRSQVRLRRASRRIL